MLWNLKMEKSEFIDTNNEIINKLKEKFNPQDTVKINLFFHLNEKEIYIVTIMNIYVLLLFKIHFHQIYILPLSILLQVKDIYMIKKIIYI